MKSDTKEIKRLNAIPRIVHQIERQETANSFSKVSKNIPSFYLVFCSFVIFRRNHQTSASVSIGIHTEFVTNHFMRPTGLFWSSYIRKKQPKPRYNFTQQKPVVISQGKPLDTKLLVEHSLPSRRRLVRAHRKPQKKSKGPPTRPEEQLSSNSEDLELRYKQWRAAPLGWSQYYNELVEWVRLFECSDRSALASLGMTF